MQELFSSPTAGRFGRRLRRERGSRIPVIVVTGFLGAGKTTLLRHFLRSPEGAGTAVVVNEFGETGIDDVVLRSSGDTVALTRDGCLCCTMRSDLQVTLHRLVADRDRGAVPHFSRIVIETSGLADPSPILATFATDRALGGEFHLQAVIAIIAAPGGTATIANFAEARRQVLLADRIVISKSDLADEAVSARLSAALRQMNPHAEIVSAAAGRLDPQWVVADRGGTFGTGFVADTPAHTDGVASFTLVYNEPIDWDSFARALETVMALRGSDLLRVKGFLNVTGCAGPVVVQCVQHLAHPPVELDHWPGADRASRVVFIALHLSARQVSDVFAAVRALAATRPP